MIDGLKRKGAPNLELMPEGRGFLLVEFGADAAADADRLARALMDQLTRAARPPAMRLYTAAEARAVWKIRESGPRAAGSGPGMPRRWEGWDDSSVAPEKLGAYLRDLRRLLDEYQYQAAYYGHFGHGCIHMQVSFDLQSAEGMRKYGEFVDEAADLVVSYGGSLSGEHGDGQSRGALLPKMFGPELMTAFREFKAAVGSAEPDEPGQGRRRVSADGQPPAGRRLHARFSRRRISRFPMMAGRSPMRRCAASASGNAASRNTARCAPATWRRSRKSDSTRGRAHMLFEMLQGEALDGVWRNEHVKEALDLCLSCKACKAECPTNVDIATYRAEFLSHYYETERRPLHAYAFGMIDRWARIGSMTPRLANAVANAPGVNAVLRKMLHLAPRARAAASGVAELPPAGRQDAACRCRRTSRMRRRPPVGRYLQQLFPARTPVRRRSTC